MITLYDMLDRTVYYQKVLILENNVFDQNMPLYYGNVDGARSDEIIWDWLTKEVDLYEYSEGVLVISVKDENYEEHLEDHYLGSDRWTKDTRPWLFGCEIRIYIRKIKEQETIPKEVGNNS